MSSTANGLELLNAARERDLDGVRVALEAGADVNGHPEQPYSPIVGATIEGHIDIIEHLLEQGADPDGPVTKLIPMGCAKCTDCNSLVPGERALHIAAKNGRVDTVRLLLERFRADPNVTDERGYTPLMAACDSSSVDPEVLRLLLETGADASLAQEKGYTPLHAVARNGHIGVVDMLYTAAPATLNRCSADGESLLFGACARGRESIVSKLLSLGAMQRLAQDAPQTCPHSAPTCPLSTAVRRGFEGVVRVMLNEGGIGAVGGELALAQALLVAVQFRRLKILRLLLAADGEERRSEWANAYLKGLHLLHYGTGYCHLDAVNILLEAGADEAARDSQMRTPRESFGLLCDRSTCMVEKIREKKVAILRMLDRGPAYRARSWAWPSAEEADVDSSGDGDAAVAAAADADAVLRSRPAVKPSNVVGVRIFRPKEKDGIKFFGRLVGRYCAKD